MYMLALLAGVDIGKSYLFGKSGVEDVFPNLGTLINVLLPNIFALAGVILFVLLIFGGLMVIFNAGGNPEQTAKGGQAVTAALLGFVIIFASYWILNIINFFLPILVQPGSKESILK
jgi:hypothetical protein